MDKTIQTMIESIKDIDKRLNDIQYEVNRINIKLKWMIYREDKNQQNIVQCLDKYKIVK